MTSVTATDIFLSSPSLKSMSIVLAATAREKSMKKLMTYQKKINMMTKVMDKAKDPDFKKIWRRKIEYLHIKHVEESMRKEGL
mgnify:FL=1